MQPENHTDRGAQRGWTILPDGAVVQTSSSREVERMRTRRQASRLDYGRAAVWIAASAAAVALSTAFTAGRLARARERELMIVLARQVRT